MMAKHEPGPLGAGWRLLWQTQRVLWWIYAVNFGLGFFAAAGLAMRLRSVLDHSLAADRLYHGFDLAYFIELAAHPDVQLATRPTSSLAFAAVFLIFMLFATGGILESYARDRLLVPGEFFQGCGAFFWRFVRLSIWLVIVLVPISIATSTLLKISSRLSSDSSVEKLGFWVEVIGLAVIMLVMMAVRLWFDLTQVVVVVEDEHGTSRTLGRTLKLLLANFRRLFWMYFQPSLIAWAGTLGALFCWIKFVPAERTGEGFLLGQFIAWLWIATRLWQRASEVVWYQRQRPEPAPLLVTVPEEHVVEVPEFTPPEAPSE